VAKSAVIVGGGLAGISAALRLADAGAQVTLLEGRPRLGGAAFSFTRGTLMIDNGQHVFLRCCDAYRALLRRLGAERDATLQHRLDIPVLHPSGRTGRLSRLPGAPAPIHLSLALARYALLRPSDRLRAVAGAFALRRLDPADSALDQQTVGHFLRAHRQNDATITALWGIIATSALNLPPEHGSLALAAKVFRTGLLDHATSADVGYAAVPLGEVHSTAAVRALQEAGVDLRLNHRVEAVEAGRVQARNRTGPVMISTDAVVLAIPPRDALGAAPSLAGTSLAGAERLGATPILNVHVIYDRRVTDLAFAAAVGSPVQWFFDRTEPSGLRSGQYLAITVSAADAIIDQPSKPLQERFIAELARLLPAAARATVVDSFVTRERRATFRQAAGSAALRPSARTTVDGVWLAGSWTATGWPDTMESAVRSGITAADGVLGVTTEGRWELAA
jgi:squalene-associated FAD-dependent desaturase